jgi:hypothetical protein
MKNDDNMANNDNTYSAKSPLGDLGGIELTLFGAKL